VKIGLPVRLDQGDLRLKIVRNLFLAHLSQYFDQGSKPATTTTRGYACRRLGGG